MQNLSADDSLIADIIERLCKEEVRLSCFFLFFFLLLSSQLRNTLLYIDMDLYISLYVDLYICIYVYPQTATPHSSMHYDKNQSKSLTQDQKQRILKKNAEALVVLCQTKLPQVSELLIDTLIRVSLLLSSDLLSSFFVSFPLENYRIYKYIYKYIFFFFILLL